MQLFKTDNYKRLNEERNAYRLLASNFFSPWSTDSNELLESIVGFELLGAALIGENGGFGELLCDLFWEEPAVLVNSEGWVSITDSKDSVYI